jgi:hypothetical protein
VGQELLDKVMLVAHLVAAVRRTPVAAVVERERLELLELLAVKAV